MKEKAEYRNHPNTVKIEKYVKSKQLFCLFCVDKDVILK